MTNIILAYPFSDTATLEGSVAPASMPVGNLKTMQPTEVYRILNPASAFINIDYQGAEIDLIALLVHTATSTAYVRVRASNTLGNVESSPDYDSGNLPMRSNQTEYAAEADNVLLENGDAVLLENGDNISLEDSEAVLNTDGAMAENNFILKLDSPVDYRYWRIDIYDTASSYLDIGRLYMSKAWQPNINIEYGAVISWADTSKIPQASSGQKVPLRRKKFRYTEFSMTFLSEDEALDYLFEFDRLRGITSDILYIKDISNKKQLQRQTIYGLMAALNPIGHDSFQLHSKSYRIEELT